MRGRGTTGPGMGGPGMGGPGHHGLDLTAAPVNQAAVVGAGVGLGVLALARGRVLPGCRLRGGELVLLGIDGTTRLAPRCELAAGQVVVWPREEALVLAALDGPSRLGLVAVPAGAEQLLTALARADLPPEVLVTLGADCGVELLLA